MLGVVIQMAVGPGQWVGIVMGRWVAGLGKSNLRNKCAYLINVLTGVGGLSVLVPLYMTETAPVKVRGAVVS